MARVRRCGVKAATLDHNPAHPIKCHSNLSQRQPSDRVRRRQQAQQEMLRPHAIMVQLPRDMLTATYRAPRVAGKPYEHNNRSFTRSKQPR